MRTYSLALRYNHEQNHRPDSCGHGMHNSGGTPTTSQANKELIKCQVVIHVIKKNKVNKWSHEDAILNKVVRGNLSEEVNVSRDLEKMRQLLLCHL